MKRLLLALLLALAAPLSAEEYVSTYDPGFVARVASASPWSLRTITKLEREEEAVLFDVGSSVRGGGSFSGGTLTTATTFNDDVSAVFGTGGGTTNSLIRKATADTPDTLVIGLGTLSRGLVICESGDEGFDFAHAQATVPTLFIHSANQSTTEWMSFSHNNGGLITTGANDLFLNPVTGIVRVNNTNGTITGASNTIIASNAGSPSRHIYNGTAKALTEASATGVITVAVASGTRSGGEIHYSVEAADATDAQVRTGTVTWSLVNKSGTETCQVSGTAGNANPTQLQDGSTLAESAGASTLTYTWGVDTTGTNTCTLTLNATSSLTQTTLQITYEVVRHTGTGTITLL